MDDTGATPAAEVAYENTADEAWARQALDLYKRGELQVRAFDTEGVVSAQAWGTCPRCRHELNVQQTLSTPIVGVRGGRGLWSALTGRDVPAAAGVPDSRGGGLRLRAGPFRRARAGHRLRGQLPPTHQPARSPSHILMTAADNSPAPAPAAPGTATTPRGGDADRPP